MKILSVNVGAKRTITQKNVERVTGIYKQPVDGPVEVTSLGLVGDLIADQKHHGGLDQALYIYGQVDYEWWGEALGEKVKPGTFGENLTVSEMESASFNIGDRLIIGKLILQVTAPRIPCAKLSACMNDSYFVKKFKTAERPGLYCRVLQAGFVTSGDRVVVERHQGETVSLLDMYRDHYTPDNTPTGLRRFLAAPIDLRTRAYKKKLLVELE
jgi:MOSC domain-containing protein YiiM